MLNIEGCKNKNIYRHKNVCISVNLQGMYKLYLSLEANFHQVFRSYFKNFVIIKMKNAS